MNCGTKRQLTTQSIRKTHIKRRSRWRNAWRQTPLSVTQI